MTSERLEVRLDPDRHDKLQEIARLRGKVISQVVRELIDEGYDEALLERRLEAVRRLAAAAVEDVPDPETLCRELDATHDLPGLY